MKPAYSWKMRGRWFLAVLGLLMGDGSTRLQGADEAPREDAATIMRREADRQAALLRASDETRRRAVGLMRARRPTEALALVTIVGLLALARPRRLLLLAALAAVPIFLGLATSYSQSSLVALCAGIFVIACVVWRWKALIAVGGIIVLVAVVTIATPQGRDLLHEPAQKASSARLGLVDRSIDLFAAHPIEGSGLGAFATATDKKKAAPHNVVAGTAAELGILGTLALLAVLLSVLWTIRNRRPDADRTTHIILAALFTTVFVHALFYDTFFADPATWVIVALLATGAGIAPLAREPEPGDWIARQAG